MGDIADAMIEGDLCEGCGGVLNGEGFGIPRYCSNECAKDRGFKGINKDGTPVIETKKTRNKKYRN